MALFASHQIPDVDSDNGFVFTSIRMCGFHFENVWIGTLFKLSVLCLNILEQLVRQDRMASEMWLGFLHSACQSSVQR